MPYLFRKTCRYAKKWFKSPSIYYMAFVALFLIDIYFRLGFLKDQVTWLDSYRDYLISHLIIRDGILPAYGPWNGSFREFSSPVYYYFIAIILSIKDSFNFLVFVNILVQLLVILVIFLATRIMFSLKSAFIAALLFSFNLSALTLSLSLWQPSFMYPFAYTSFFFLLLSHIKKSNAFLIISVVLFALAGIFHNSAFTLIPTFFLAIFLIIKATNQKKTQVVKFFMFYIVLNVLFYLPVFLRLGIIEGESIFKKIFSYLSFSPQNIKGVVSLLALDTSFSNFPRSIGDTIISVVLIIVLVMSTIFYFWKIQSGGNKKIYLLILILLIFSNTLIPIFSRVNLQDRYFVLSIGFLAILIAEVISTIFSKKLFLNILKVILILLFIKIFIGNFGLFLAYIKGDVLSDPVLKSAAIIEKNIRAIKKENNYDDFNFFQITDLRIESDPGFYTTPEYWAYLEKTLGEKLVVIDNNTEHYQFKTLNSDDYVFIICDPRIVDYLKDDCLTTFLNDKRVFIDKQKYSIVKTITIDFDYRYGYQSPFVIYIAKKE